MKDIFYYLPQRLEKFIRDKRIKDLILILEKINLKYKANKFEDAL